MLMLDLDAKQCSLLVHQLGAPHRLCAEGNGRPFDKLTDLIATPMNVYISDRNHLEFTVLKQKIASEMAAKVSEVLAMTPARDVEKNLKASLAAWLSRLDLVTREEFDVQAQVLARTREKLQELEARLASLESGTRSE